VSKKSLRWDFRRIRLQEFERCENDTIRIPVCVYTGFMTIVLKHLLSDYYPPEC
jgi:hypothetical protein